MKYIFIFFTLLCGFNARSQNFFTSLYGGIANYQGDLEEKPFSISHSHPAWGLGLLFELNDRMLIRGDFTYGRISGDDSKGEKNKARNLNFTSTISEFSLGFEYVLFNLYEHKVSPYVFTSLAVFKFSPYAKDKNNNLASLYELCTEGQGFYKDRKPYKLTQLSIPFGGGLQWAISNNARVGFVVGIRKTFTDYLDDVSTTYVDKDLLTLNKGGNAAAYAYRGDELPNGAPYPPDGTKRGSPEKKDWYYFSGITFRVRLTTHGRKRVYTFKPGKANISCPKPF